MANDQAHDIPSEHSTSTEMNNETIQSNCQTHTSVDSLVQMNLKRETPSVDIKLGDYKKLLEPISTGKSTTSQAVVPLFGDMSEFIQSSTAQNEIASLELTKIHQSVIENSSKYHEHAGIDPFSTIDDDNHRQRSLSSSSMSSSSTSSDDQQRNEHFPLSSTIPYQTLYNDEDDDNPLEETTNQKSS